MTGPGDDGRLGILGRMSTVSTSAARLPADARDLVGRQQDVLTREQLERAGISDRQIASRAAGGAWRPLGPRVVVLHSGPLTRDQQWWVGVLHGARDAALALASAAEVGGLRGFEDPDVHVAIAHGREVGDITDPVVNVRVHQSRHVLADVVALRAPARQSVARSVVELASAAPHDNRTRAVIAASVQQRLVRPAHLRSFIGERRTLPKRRLILETVGDVQGGAHSLPELEYSHALRRTGLPQPVKQSKIRRHNGTWYLDNDFEEWQVTVEVNGIQHRELLASESDDIRRSALQIGGRIVVDISSYAVRHQIGQTMLRTAQALVAHGYRPDRRAQLMLAQYSLEHPELVADLGLTA